MYTDSNQIREKIKELTEDLQLAGERRDWNRCDELEIDIEDLTRILQLKERSSYYYIEK